MTSCCDSKSRDLETLAKQQSMVLWIVFFINIVMFFVEAVSGILGNSLALVSDSFDMLGDSIAYASSLYVVRMGVSAKASAARLKGWLILISGVLIFANAVYRFMSFEMPSFELMGVVGVIALLANLLCLFLLTKHKDDDVNMTSIWTCSRNDIVSNASVLGAAALVYWLKTPWPDLLTGSVLAVFFIFSAKGIFKNASEVT